MIASLAAAHIVFNGKNFEAAGQLCLQISLAQLSAVCKQQPLGENAVCSQRVERVL